MGVPYHAGSTLSSAQVLKSVASQNLTVCPWQRTRWSCHGGRRCHVAGGVGLGDAIVEAILAGEGAILDSGPAIAAA